jgi:hypothetical protein
VSAFIAFQFFSAVDEEGPTLYFGVSHIPTGMNPIAVAQEQLGRTFTELLRSTLPPVIDSALSRSQMAMWPVSTSRESFDQLVFQCRQQARQAIHAYETSGRSMLWPPSACVVKECDREDDIRLEIEDDDEAVVMTHDDLGRLVCNVFLEELDVAVRHHEAAVTN